MKIHHFSFKLEKKMFKLTHGKHVILIQAHNPNRKGCYIKRHTTSISEANSSHGPKIFLIKFFFNVRIINLIYKRLALIKLELNYHNMPR